MKYSDQLLHPKWQAKRLSVLKRDKFKCKKCGDEETTLHVHHLKYESGKLAWEIENKYLLTLCSDCHMTIESIKKGNIFYFKENPEIGLVKICKLNKWGNKQKIILASYKGWASIQIYNQSNDFVTGFNLDPDTLSIFKSMLN